MAANLYEACGGTEGCRRLSVAFYSRVARDPILRPLFPGKSFTCAIEAFTAFLVQFLGGPSDDSQRRWWLSLSESHQRFKIGPREREAWIADMVQALEDVRLEEPLRSVLLGFFEDSSAYVVNHGAATGAGKADSGDPHAEISRRWEAQLQLDKAVTAIRSGDGKRAIQLAETCGRAVQSGLLALMVRSGQPALIDHVSATLTKDPTLAQEHYAGRTLLHEAAAAGSLATVELLLSLGADPNAQDGGGHTPLYSVGNECAVEDGGKVVRALVHAGAEVDADDGVKHCTPLHMAARRGNVDVAAALLDSGAHIEARDSLGDTPLRRAVNCSKPGVTALLLDRGADLQSRGSKGITPLDAARTGSIKQLLDGAAR